LSGAYYRAALVMTFFGGLVNTARVCCAVSRWEYEERYRSVDVVLFGQLSRRKARFVLGGQRRAMLNEKLAEVSMSLRGGGVDWHLVLIVPAANVCVGSAHRERTQQYQVT